MNNKMTFGAWLRATRKGTLMSQRALASKIGVTFSYVSKLESDGQTVGEDTIERIAFVLLVPVDEVYRRAGRVPRYIREAFAEGLSDDDYAKIKAQFRPKAAETKWDITPERDQWIAKLLRTMALDLRGTWYQTRPLKTVRDVIRPGSSTAAGWGQIVVDGYGWTLYHVGAGEIAHAQWEEALR